MYDKPIYAGFGLRFLAILLDYMVLTIPAVLISIYFQEDLIISILSAAMFMIYKAEFESSHFQATPGKMVMGLKVVGSSRYNRISFRQAILRHLGFVISAFSLFIGFAMAGFTKRKQGLHDKIASTLVVRKNSL